MANWNSTQITADPEESLEFWRVFEVPLHGYAGPWTRHFVGRAMSTHRGRATSAVLGFDARTGQGELRDERVFKLEGFPGSYADVAFTWEQWLRYKGVDSEPRDVTEEVWAEIQQAEALEFATAGVDDVDPRQAD